MNRALLAKYSVPGPRYTSYPTVPYWDHPPAEKEWAESVTTALCRGEEGGVGASVYIHIPFCASRCAYCGCNTRLTRSREVIRPYIESVQREWSMYGKARIAELHVGGGTPTFLTGSELDRLISGILAGAAPADGAAFSLEADPRNTTTEHLETLARLGFRRLSLGVQDFDPVVQKTIGRENSPGLVRQVVERARELDFRSICFDLIYGLPLQTADSLCRTMEEVRALRPERIAFYSHAYVPWVSPEQRRFSVEDLPSPEAKRALYELGRALLEESGYREIGMDHFALPEDELWKAAEARTLHRNFMGYTPRFVSPLIGLGVSAIGDSWGMFAQNEKTLELYEAKVREGRLPVFRGHVLDEEDLVLRKHVLALMTRFGTAWESRSLQTPFLDGIGERLAEPVRDGLVELGPFHCRITEEGRPFLRNICMAFDARLARRSPQTRLFSQTI